MSFITNRLITANSQIRLAMSTGSHGHGYQVQVLVSAGGFAWMAVFTHLAGLSIAGNVLLAGKP